MNNADLLGSMRFAYADPPYPGQAQRHYADHPDYAGEVDHAELIRRLYSNFDGFVLHTSAPAIPLIAPHIRKETRWCAWVKPFAAFKANIPLAYAWEPVLIQPVRKQVVSGRIKPLRDWLAESITLKKGLSGAKPERVCHWLFEALGAQPIDQITDLFPGTGAVTDAWQNWCESYADTTPEPHNTERNDGNF